MSQNICIYFSDTGGGHRSAADAVEAAIRKLIDKTPDKSAVCIIKDTVAEKSHPINRFMVELYNYLLRHHQPLMKYYYSLIHLLRPETGINLALTEKYFVNRFRYENPNLIVSVHPMVSHCTAYALKKSGIKDSVKLIVVVTDPNEDLWRAWACPDADVIIAPNEIVKIKLMEWGIPQEKIDVLGMPIHPDFVTAPTIDRTSFLTHLGLASDVPTVCINAGWAGGGNMLKIYDSLSRTNRRIQCIFLCGHNTDLYEKAMEAATKSEIPTAVLPFHDCMSDLMASVDMMVTKAGGLTTYQAIARRLPVAFDLLTEPMPQERGTIDMLVSQKLASRVNTPDDIIQIVENLACRNERTATDLPATYNLNLTDTAPDTIANCVLKSCTPAIDISKQGERHAVPPHAVPAERSAD
jgi:UDP-N-acetylglucosamine:LPS N-acetylglucosamine transferase